MHPSAPYDLRGIPWIVAGGALVVGGIFVHGDAGRLLMFGGVVSSAYGLFIYFWPDHDRADGVRSRPTIP